MINKLSHQAIQKLYQTYPDLFPEEKKDYMRYGLEIIIGEFVKLILLMFFFFITGLFKPFLHTLLIFWCLRFWGGGYHYKTFKGCLFVTTIYFFIIIMFSKVYSLHIYSISTNYINITLLMIVGIFLAPIFSKHQLISQKMYYLRKMLHTFTMLFLAFLTSTNVAVLEPSILIFSLLGYNLQLILGGVKNGHQKKFI